MLDKTSMHPDLEQCGLFWSPSRKMMELEKVKRRATTEITGMEYLSREESLESLQLVSLELVRLREDMTEVYKIMKMVNKVNADLSFVKFCNMITRWYTGKLV